MQAPRGFPYFYYATIAFYRKTTRGPLIEGLGKGPGIRALKVGRELNVRGMAAKEIAEITGLTLEEVEALKPDS